MSTTHNPTNFQPQDYDILGYFDNQPPQYFWGMSVEAYNAERAFWHKERDELFPEANCYRCQHCGNGNVRYVVAAVHKPTGKHVCFGDICVDRLGFANHDAFAAEKIRSKASDAAKRLRRETKAREFAAANGLDLEAFAKEPHASNSFIQDVLAKLFRYGDLSPRQVEAIKQSAERAAKREQERAAQPAPSAPAPEGRVEVQGVILSIKWKDSDFSRFGGCFKMLVKLPTGAKVYGTAPSAYDLHAGDEITFTATFERSQKDPFFGFYKRPHVKAVKAAAASAQAGQGQGQGTPEVPAS